ncbi:transmembrane protein 64 [Lingula anatina]|uniref:Transmembrane protein 64 n=1 Tax=Lingula anatina TaxID=7574 RepID=A0A1S3H7G7_LINAN|nr:transmembrane protein 64 [Lingula anatina]|eukprot:XP_013381431.1 transmembrane protein 64 [Lingula anatina]
MFHRVVSMDNLRKLPAQAAGGLLPVLGQSSKFDEVLVNLELPSPSAEAQEKAFVPTDAGIVSNETTATVETPSKRSNCLQFSLSTVVVIAVVLFMLILCREYIKILLIWLGELDVWQGCLIYLVLFTVVSFPMTWGYVLLNISCGYLYGCIFGTFTVILCVLIGVTISHFVVKHFFYDCVSTRLQNENLMAVVKVIEGKQGFKVVALARLTPIPFGLQNGLFAITQMSAVKYLCASTLGLLPTQILNAYIGSTLRSMEDVLSDDSNQTTGWIVFITQLVFTVLLMFFVVRKARNELKKTVDEQETGEDLVLIEDDSADPDGYVKITIPSSSSPELSNGYATRSKQLPP